MNRSREYALVLIEKARGEKRRGAGKGARRRRVRNLFLSR
jgi:hypothetical protein